MGCNFRVIIILRNVLILGIFDISHSRVSLDWFKLREYLVSLFVWSSILFVQSFTFTVFGVMSYDSDVAAATNGIGGDIDWDKIIKLCDRIRESYGSTAMGSALNAVMRRVKNLDQHVQLQALTLLEACVSNCGKDFQLELTKSSFHAQVREILFSRAMSPKAIQMFKALLATWSSDYRNDRAMSGLVKFVDQLVSEGVIVLQGGAGAGGMTTQPIQSTTSPTPVEDDLQKAIRLSLEEAKSTNNTSVSMYPSFSPSQNSTQKPPGKKVRALYDFEAVEDNELTFKAGEIITVTNDSDDKWWRGETQLGSGLFPVNFVSTDLNASPEPVIKAKTSSTSATGGNTNGSTSSKSVAINEAQVDLLLEMLKTADITSTNAEENKTLKGLEGECNQMRTQVEKEIDKHQKQLDKMAEVSEKLQEAFQLYRKLLQEGPRISEKPSTMLSQQQQHYHNTPHESGPPPYQLDAGGQQGYFAPLVPDSGFQTLPPPQSLSYSQSYATPPGPPPPPMSMGGGYGGPPQYNLSPHPAGGPPPPSIQIPNVGGQPTQQYQYQPPWNAAAGGNGENPQMSSSPSLAYPMTISQPLM